MTILETRNWLVNYFLNSKVFNLDQIADVFPHQENIHPLEFKQVVIFALESLEEDGVVKGFVKNPLDKLKGLINFNDCWILVKPIESFSQSVEISGLTAALICKVINEACDDFEDNENICNSLNISSKDIDNLIKLILQSKGDTTNFNFEDEDEEGEE